MARYPSHGDLASYCQLGLFAALFVATIAALLPAAGFDHESLAILSSDVLPLDGRLGWNDEIRPLDLQPRQALKDFIGSTVRFLARRSVFSGEAAVVVGTPRLRQVRAADDFVNIYGTPCEWAGEGREPRKGAANFTATRTAWVYSPDAGLPVMQGRRCPVPNRGYFLDLFSPAIANNASCKGSAKDCYLEHLTAVLAELEQGEWVDSLTRTVSLSFTLYDKENEIFCSAQFVWENLAFDSWWMTPAVHSNFRQPTFLFYLTLGLAVAFAVTDLLSFVYSRSKRTLQSLVIDLIIIMCLSCILHGNGVIGRALDAMR